jgi:hypothetical protein
VGAEAVIRLYSDEDSASLLDCIAELQDAERASDGRLGPVASLRQIISSRIGVLSDNTAARALYLD